MKSEPKIISYLREQRERAGLSQLALAERVGVSRQALIAIEAGRQVPATRLALLLARALSCGVDDLFQLAQLDGLHAQLATGAERSGALSEGVTSVARPHTAQVRTVLGQVDGRWVAHLLDAHATTAADGLIQRAELADCIESQRAVRVEPLVAPVELAQNVLIAGCAPLLGVLAQRAAQRYRDTRVSWLSTNGEQALDWLEAGLVHVAGLHHGTDGRGNLAILRRRFRGRALLVVHLTRWRQGLVVPPGNPNGIQEVADLLRPGLRIARRERAAGATQLAQRLLVAAGHADLWRPEGPVAISHGAVAQLVECGAADVGVAVEGAAMAAGLDFVPLAEERFDLVLPAERAGFAPLARCLDLLQDRVFRAEAECLPGYDGAMCGETVRVDAA